MKSMFLTFVAVLVHLIIFRASASEEKLDLPIIGNALVRGSFDLALLDADRAVNGTKIRFDYSDPVRAPGTSTKMKVSVVGRFFEGSNAVYQKAEFSLPTIANDRYSERLGEAVKITTITEADYDSFIISGKAEQFFSSADFALTLGHATNYTFANKIRIQYTDHDGRAGKNLSVTVTVVGIDRNADASFKQSKFEAALINGVVSAESTSVKFSKITELEYNSFKE